MSLETALFARHILLDTQSSANVVAAAELLTRIRRTSDGIILSGIDKDSDGIKVDMVGQLGEIETVFYSPKASANVLSFAAMSDAGATIRFVSIRFDSIRFKT